MLEPNRYHSISRRLPLLISISFLILIFIAISITFFRVERRMINEYRRMADGVTNLMIEALDPDKMDFYIEKNYSAPEYMAIMKYFYKLKDNYPDIFYMYVYRLYKDESNAAKGTIIIDLEDEYTDTPNQASIDWVGGIYDLQEPFASNIDDLISKKESVYKAAFSEEDGYLLSFAKPIFDKNGNYVASACVDFSMQVLHNQTLRFIFILALILLLITLAILAVSVWWLRRNVTKPLLYISNTVANFKYDTEEDRNINLDTIKNLDIHSNNEIGILYDALLEAEKDSVFYMTSFKKAEDEIHVKDEKIEKLGTMALRDSMTNVGNKAAFTRAVSEIRDNDVYGVVLMDANNLKMINDTYGHEAGDEYIKGCCSILCDTFKHSPVFRIGGDEFAVILKGQDYKNRIQLIKEIKNFLDKIWVEKKDDPVHRFSCSIGIADSSNCKSTRETIKTADDNMYLDKKAFKKVNGSYR